MTDLSRWSEILTTRGLRLLVILVGALVLARLVKALTSRLVQPAKNQSRAAHIREEQTRAAARLLENVGRVAVTIVAIVVALPEFGFTLMPAILFAGSFLFVIGIAGRGLIADSIMGVSILSEDQYGIGDLIRVNGETGRVEQLTWRRTVIRNERGAFVTISNRAIEQVANLSREWSQTAFDVTVPSSELVGPALRILEKVAADFREDAAWSAALVDGPRVLGVESLELEGTNLRVQVRTALLRQDDVARELRRRIRIAFEEAAIKTTGLQRVELIQAPK